MVSVLQAVLLAQATSFPPQVASLDPHGRRTVTPAHAVHHLLLSVLKGFAPTIAEPTLVPQEVENVSFHLVLVEELTKSVHCGHMEE